MYPMEHIWTILMLKILHAYLLRTFVANSKIDAIYALYPENFCRKNLAIRKVFAFCDSDRTLHWLVDQWLCSTLLLALMQLGG